MKKSILLIVLLKMTALLLTGCGKSPEKEVKDLASSMKKMYSPQQDKDVTADPYYNFSSFTGTVWKTKVKTAIAELKRYTGAPETKLLSPERFDATHPKYNPPSEMKLVTVLPIGTQIRIAGLMKDQGAWGGVQVTATLEDRTNGDRTVYLDGWLLAENKYMLGVKHLTNWTVNPEMLEAVK